MPNAFLTELLDLLQALWATPNRWLRRLIIVAAATPFLSMLMGMLWGPLAMVTALVPVLVVVGWVTLAIDPLVIGIINRYSFGKKLTGWVVLICGMELAWAFFCGIFPLENDLRVSFTALFALLAAAALAGGSAYLKLEFGWPKKLAKLLVFAAVVCGIILLLGGRKHAAENVSGVREVISETFSKVATASRKVGRGSDGVPVCAGARDISLGFSDSGAEVPLDPVCWSGWIQLPPSADLSIRNGNVALEMAFIDGTRWDVSGPPKHAGTVPTSTFRLRGEGGKAAIFLSPSI